MTSGAETNSTEMKPSKPSSWHLLDHAPEVDPALVGLGLERVGGGLLGLVVAGVGVERLDVVGLEAELCLVGVVDGERQAGHGFAELDRVLRLPCDGEDARLDVAVDAESLRHVDHALVLDDTDVSNA